MHVARVFLRALVRNWFVWLSIVSTVISFFPLPLRATLYLRYIPLGFLPLPVWQALKTLQKNWDTSVTEAERRHQSETEALRQEIAQLKAFSEEEKKVVKEKLQLLGPEHRDLLRYLVIRHSDGTAVSMARLLGCTRLSGVEVKQIVMRLDGTGLAVFGHDVAGLEQIALRPTFIPALQASLFPRRDQVNPECFTP